MSLFLGVAALGFAVWVALRVGIVLLDKFTLDHRPCPECPHEMYAHITGDNCRACWPHGTPARR